MPQAPAAIRNRVAACGCVGLHRGLQVFAAFGRGGTTVTPAPGPRAVACYHRCGPVRRRAGEDSPGGACAAMGTPSHQPANSVMASVSFLRNAGHAGERRRGSGTHREASRREETQGSQRRGFRHSTHWRGSACQPSSPRRSRGRSAMYSAQRSLFRPRDPAAGLLSLG